MYFITVHATLGLSHYKDVVLPEYVGIPVTEIRRPNNRLIFMMKSLYPERRFLYWNGVLMCLLYVGSLSYDSFHALINVLTYDLTSYPIVCLFVCFYTVMMSLALVHF